MDSRTKFYGPVLAMLSLSAVAFNGFVIPPLENDPSNSESRDPQEDVQSADPPSEPDTSDNPDSVSATEDTSPEDRSADSSAPPDNASDTNPEPTTFLDLLFIPIPDEATQSSTAE